MVRLQRSQRQEWLKFDNIETKLFFMHRCAVLCIVQHSFLIKWMKLVSKFSCGEG